MRDWYDRLTRLLATRPLDGFDLDVTLGALLGAVGVMIVAWGLGVLAVAIVQRVARRLHPDSAGPSKGVRRGICLTVLVLGAGAALRVLGLELAQLLDTHLFQLGVTEVTVTLVLAAGLVVLLSYALSLMVRRGLDRTAKRQDTLARSSLKSIGRLLHYAIMAIGVVVAFETLGFDLNAILAVGGLMAIAIGFAMQTVVSNFVSGVILLVERAIKPDDVIEIEGRFVRVRSLGIRATKVRTRDGEDMIVPNSVIVQGVVKNFTDADMLLRVRVSVGVAYDSDLRAARAALERAAGRMPGRSTLRPADVILTQFGTSSVDFEVRAWIDDPWNDAHARSNLLQAIWDALHESGIVIAFPQLDVHFDEPVPAPRAASA